MTDKIRHCIYRSYIAMARCEEFPPKEYTDEMMKADMTNEELALSHVVWSWDERVMTQIWEYRGLNGLDQFKRGIVGTPGQLANRLMCKKLQEIYGIEKLLELERFQPTGEMRWSSKYDFITPLKDKDGWIEDLGFYTLEQMRKWPKR